ncbi:MAG: manganese efflux pump MntP family protein [Firmicutes bacterium]|nr:manganese efflux pump MntP family protein [[Eubacterium] siraeum]MCM1488828.1 manganese efflux pump MntP family protein [Bacillota bacterium]
MGIIELFLIAVGLSMDAFAVSIGNGLSMKKENPKAALAIAFSFGLFQAVMPTAGYFLGSAFEEVIREFDHYIALVFLGFIGGKMIYDGIKELKAKKSGAEEEDKSFKLSFGALMIQAVATSIDALIVGVSFAALPDVNIWAAVTLIGITTFAISLIGVFFGKKFGQLLGSRAEILGGIILVGIGLKVFIEHTFFGG